jgi:hypothetical protein
LHRSISIVIVDKHAQPGGHWNDSYPFVSLHQAARNYGVESLALEEKVADRKELRATRSEILDYYAQIMEGFVANFDVKFIRGVQFDFASASLIPVEDSGSGAAASRTVSAATVVDARWTENDLPVTVKPKFDYSEELIDLIPPNELPTRAAAAGGGGDAAERKYYCVIGAGKTGQDTVMYLQNQLGIGAFFRSRRGLSLLFLQSSSCLPLPASV